MSDVPFRGLRTLVTGASGFLASHLCERLSACGGEVHATSRDQRSNPHPRFTWWQTDLTDGVAVQKLLGEIRPDVVFHLAGRVTAAPDLSLVFPTFCSLLMSTVNILVGAETVGCKRLVMTGSLTEPAAGVSEPIPSSPYAAAKWTGSAYARMFHQLYGTPVVIVRPFMTYGPRQQMEKIIPHVISSLLQGDRPRLSSGKWVADWIYVDDVIDGFMLAASKPTIDGCTIDLGSGTLTSVSVVVKKLVGLINPNIEPMFCSFADRPSESIRAADLGATTASLGWEPSTTLDQGLARTIEWYRDRLSK